jgi:hypothetical protein
MADGVKWGAAAILTIIIIVCMVMLNSSNEPPKILRPHIEKVQVELPRQEHSSQGANQFQEFETLEKELKEIITEKQEILKTGYGGSTLLLENRLVFQNYTPSDRHAIVTMIGCSSYVHSYWMGGLALIQSLREVQTRVPNIVVMIRRNQGEIPDFAFEAFERLGVQLIDIDRIELAPHVEIPGTWGMVYLQFQICCLI